MKIWDMVPIHSILEESGCICTDFFGKQIVYSKPMSRKNEKFSICAAPSVLHEQLQSIIYKSGS